MKLKIWHVLNDYFWGFTFAYWIVHPLLDDLPPFFEVFALPVAFLIGGGMAGLIKLILKELFSEEKNEDRNTREFERPTIHPVR